MSASFEQRIMALVIPLEQRLLNQNDELSSAMLTHPASWAEMSSAIELINDEIRAGERIQVTVPRDYSHDSNGELNWDNIEEIQMDVRGHLLNPNVFATLRFDVDAESDVVVDICAVAEMSGGVPRQSARVAISAATAVPQAPAPVPVPLPKRLVVETRQLAQGGILELTRGLFIRYTPDGYVVLGKVTDINNPDITALIELTVDDDRFAAERGIIGVRQTVIPDAAVSSSSSSASTDVKSSPSL